MNKVKDGFKNFIDFAKAQPIYSNIKEKPMIFVKCGRAGTFCYNENDVMSAEQDAITRGMPVEYRLVKYGNCCETLVNTTRGDIIHRLRNNDFFTAEELEDDSDLESAEIPDDEEPEGIIDGKTKMKRLAEKEKAKQLKKNKLTKEA